MRAVPADRGRGVRELVASIKEEGLREPIVILEGAILDGRNRYNACLAAGVEPVFTPFRGDDPVRFVLAANVHRRHLNESQRATIAAKIANLTHGGDRRSDQAANLPVPTQAEAAEMLNVSERSVRTARKVLEQAESADIEAITKGKATVSGIAKKLSTHARPITKDAPSKRAVAPEQQMAELSSAWDLLLSIWREASPTLRAEFLNRTKGHRQLRQHLICSGATTPTAHRDSPDRHTAIDSSFSRTAAP